MNNTKNTSDFIFVVMAIIFVVTAIVGFIPTSLGLITGVASGQQPLPPPVVHFHAASMALWLLMLLAQSLLMYRKRRDLHRKLGLFSIVLAPCVLVAMYGVEMLNVERSLAASQAASTGQATDSISNVSSALLIHGVSYLFFPTFYLWAILVRRKDNETHKRMMILATLVLMVPAIGRLLSVSQLLPDFGLNRIDARHLYLWVLITPALVYDVARRRVPHRAYLVGLTLVGIWMISAHFLWSSPWWAETAPGLLGM